MNRLCNYLKSSKLAQTSHFHFSGVQESGEGEHKIMEAWRKFQPLQPTTQQQQPLQNNALYGLDADLIILSMLNRSTVGNVWLFREDVQEGQIIREPSGEERFVWFNIQRLENILTKNHSISGAAGTSARQYLTNYLFAMTALGNDFLPTGLSLKLREDGHDRLLQALDSVKPGMESNHALLAFFRNLAADESARVQTFIRRKISQSDSIGIETGLGQKNYPLSRVHFDEGALLDTTGKLHRDWDARYLVKYFPGVTKHRICREYIRGMRWVWNYYTGQMDEGSNESDKWTWVYPWHMPPLWGWLVKYLETYDLSQIGPAPQAQASHPLELQTKLQTKPKPLEQLTLVLPIQSLNLIPCQWHRQFSEKFPQYFPSKYTFFSTGRRFFWECEADIPIPTIMEIRRAVAASQAATQPPESSE
jgi:5'-3' exonuclease